MDHVATQLPYACVVASSAFIGYLVAGFTQSLALSLICAFAVMICVTSFLHFRNIKLDKKAQATA